jgi:hypothetical protein
VFYSFCLVFFICFLFESGMMQLFVAGTLRWCRSQNGTLKTLTSQNGSGSSGIDKQMYTIKPFIFWWFHMIRCRGPMRQRISSLATCHAPSFRNCSVLQQEWFEVLLAVFIQRFSVTSMPRSFMGVVISQAKDLWSWANCEKKLHSMRFRSRLLVGGVLVHLQNSQSQ